MYKEDLFVYKTYIERKKKIARYLPYHLLLSYFLGKPWEAVRGLLSHLWSQVSNCRRTRVETAHGFTQSKKVPYFIFPSWHQWYLFRYLFYLNICISKIPYHYHHLIFSFRSLKCPFCPKSFSSDYCLKSHLVSHADARHVRFLSSDIL